MCAPIGSIAAKSSITTVHSKLPSIEKLKRISAIHFPLLQENSQLSVPAVSNTKKTQKENLYRALCTNGYIELAQILLNKQGFPWDEISTLSSPLLMEQVAHLYIFCDKSIALTTPNARQKLFSFCLKIAQNQEEKTIFFEKKTVTDFNIFLGKLLYLMDLNLQDSCDLIDLNEIDISKEKIEKKFHDRFIAISKEITAHIEKHRKIGIQNCYRIATIKLSIEIAKMLITQIGTINVGLIPIIKENFLPKDKALLSHEVGVNKILTLLLDSPEIRTEVAATLPPHSSETSAGDIIRITLSLPCNAAVTHVETKKVILSALLSHLRQGNAGSCFATYVAITMLSSNPRRCLIDFQEMLRNSKLTRQINHKHTEFPFLMRIDEESLHSELTLNQKGQLIKQDKILEFIWESPGIQAACKAIGIENTETAIKELLLKVFSQQEGIQASIVLSAKVLLSKIILQNTLKDSEDTSPLLDRAILAFEAETQNILLRMWENALAGMAESKENGLLKHSIIESISKTIKEQLNVITGEKLNWESFLNSMTQELMQRIQLQYSPQIPYNNASNDGHSGEGAFVLYDCGETSGSTNWKLINQTTFQNFVGSILHRAYENSYSCSISNIDLMRKSYGDILQFINNQSFMEKVLKEYDAANKSNPDILKQMELLEHTPWLDKNGNDPIEVLYIYHERMTPFPHQVKFIPLNAQQLLDHLIEIGKTLDPNTKDELKKNANLRLPLIVHGLHACSLLLGHPSLAKAWKSNAHTGQWITKSLIHPGQAIAQSLISTFSCEALIKHMEKFIPKDIYLNFKKEASRIKQSLTVCKFRNALLNVIRKVYTNENPLISVIAAEMDKCLCQIALPEKQRNTLAESAVHFADTNWFREAHDVHFCCIVNPGTAQLEMWKIFEDNTGLSPCNQIKWVFKRQWHFISGLDKS